QHNQTWVSKIPGLGFVRFGLRASVRFALFLISGFARLLLSRVTAYELKEVARLPTGRFILIEESQFLLFKLLKKLIPANLFKCILASVAGEVDAQDAWFTMAFRAFYGCRFALTCFCPSFDLIMIRSY